MMKYYYNYLNASALTGSLENAATTLKELAIKNGAPNDTEIIQMRNAGNLILFGLPGTLQRLDDGTFPPPPPQSSSEEDEDDMTTGLSP